MTKFLINEPHLQTSPTLAAKFGLNEAIVLQQLHFRLSNSPLKYGGYTWYHHTYAKWQKQFPFWSERTISRIFVGLENQGLIVSTQHYNEMKINKTKWYRIDYAVLNAVLESQIDLLAEPKRKQATNKKSHELASNLETSDLKDLKNDLKENNVRFVFEVINYLNQKTQKEFRANNSTTNRLINGRLAEGYKLEDFKKVIDIKVRQWLARPEMKLYLRPSTLFSPTNFENYLNESNNAKQQLPNRNIARQPIILDFEAGEED